MAIARADNFAERHYYKGNKIGEVSAEVGQFILGGGVSVLRVREIQLSPLNSSEGRLKL